MAERLERGGERLALFMFALLMSLMNQGGSYSMYNLSFDVVDIDILETPFRYRNPDTDRCVGNQGSYFVTGSPTP